MLHVLHVRDDAPCPPCDRCVAPPRAVKDASIFERTGGLTEPLLRSMDSYCSVQSSFKDNCNCRPQRILIGGEVITFPVT